MTAKSPEWMDLTIWHRLAFAEQGLNREIRNRTCVKRFSGHAFRVFERYLRDVPGKKVEKRKSRSSVALISDLSWNNAKAETGRSAIMWTWINLEL